MLDCSIADKIFGNHEVNWDKPSQSSFKNNDSVELQYTKQLRDQGIKVADGSLCKFTGTHWQTEKLEDSEFKASRWLESVDPSKFTPNRISGLVKAPLKGLDRLGEATPDLIPTLGGYLTVRKNAEGKHEVHLNQHDPDCNIRYCINAELLTDEEWDKAESSLFFKLINRILPNPDVRALVQEYIGYTLLGDTRFQTAQIWLGSGANGKGTLSSIIRALHQKSASADLTALNGFNLEPLIGASLVVVDEVGKGAIHDQALKSLVSGDLVRADRKFRTAVDFNCMAKWIICGNALPRSLDKTDGFFRRFQHIHFGVTIPKKERDGKLAETIIRLEIGIVLKWALFGLLRLLDRGYFDEPASVLEANQMARICNSSVLQHISDAGVLVSNPNRWTPKKVIYKAYRDWCLENGKGAEAADGFWTQVRRECERLGITISEKQLRVAGEKTRCVDIAIEPHPLDDEATVKQYSAKELLENGRLVEVSKDDNPF